MRFSAGPSRPLSFPFPPILIWWPSLPSRHQQNFRLALRRINFPNKPQVATIFTDANAHPLIKFRDGVTVEESWPVFEWHGVNARGAGNTIQTTNCSQDGAGIRSLYVHRTRDDI